MKGIIIYKSKYGATRQYSEWIHEETGFSTVSMNELKQEDMTDKDVIILGCPVMAYRPHLSKWIQKNWNGIKEKKVFLFTTSGAPSSDPKLIEGFKASLPEEISNSIHYTPFGGRMIFDKLSGMDKLMMKIGQKMEKDPVIKEKMLEDSDKVDRNEISSLVKAVNQSQ